MHLGGFDIDLIQPWLRQLKGKYDKITRILGLVKTRLETAKKDVEDLRKEGAEAKAAADAQVEQLTTSIHELMQSKA